MFNMWIRQVLQQGVCGLQRRPVRRLHHILCLGILSVRRVLWPSEQPVPGLHNVRQREILQRRVRARRRHSLHPV